MTRALFHKPFLSRGILPKPERTTPARYMIHIYIYIFTLNYRYVYLLDPSAHVVGRPQVRLRMEWYIDGFRPRALLALTKKALSTLLKAVRAQVVRIPDLTRFSLILHGAIKRGSP